MSPETARRIQLTVSINGARRVELTKQGLMAHELVRIDRSLRNHENPSISFAIMLKGMVCAYSERRDELCRLLGLPDDKTAKAKIIKGYDRRLRKIGHPYWRFE